MARHGTNAGYQQHLRTGVPLCTQCRRAHNAHRRGEKPPAPTRTVLPTRWMDRAACAGILDFPDWPVDRQKTHCGRCPVQAACLDFALAQPEIVRDSATFAGLTGREQIEERRQRRQAARGRVDQDGFDITTTPQPAVAHKAAPRLEVNAQLPGVRERRRVLVDNVAFLLGAGTGPEEAARRLGKTTEALSRALQRAGRYDLARPFQAAHQRTRGGEG